MDKRTHPHEAATADAPRAPWRPYYAALAPAERALYEHVAAGLLAHEEAISLGGYATEAVRLEDLLDALRREVPEIAFDRMAVVRRAGVRQEAPGRALRLEVGYADDAREAAALLRTMEDRARDAVARARSQARGRDHLMALYLHDWLLERCTYDTSAPYAHDAAGALALGRAVCEGIAKAYKFLCDRAGLPCAFATGHSRTSGGPHAWDIVYAAKRWSHVDVTDDLPGAESGEPPSRAHFGLSDARIAADRTVDPGHPACPQGLGYYESIGMTASDERTLANIVARRFAAAAEPFEVKLVGPLAYGGGTGTDAALAAIDRACATCGAGRYRVTWQGMDVVRLAIEAENGTRRRKAREGIMREGRPASWAPSAIAAASRGKGIAGTRGVARGWAS